MKRGVIKGLFLLAVLGLTCGFIFTNAMAAPAKEINIGATYDFSGATSWTGPMCGPVVENIAKEINAKGGINGRPIKVHVQDNGGDPQKLLGVLKMFKELNKCVAIIAGPTSTVAIAAKAWAEQNHIPVVSPDPMSDQVRQKEGKSWLFVPVDYNTLRTEGALRRVKKMGYTEIAFEGTTLAWGTDQLATLKQVAPKFEIKLIGEVLIEPKSKDVTIQATKLRDTGTKALFLCEYGTETGTLARALKAIGWNPYVMHSSGGELTGTTEQYPGWLIEGWETLLLTDYTKPEVTKVFDVVEKWTGTRYKRENVLRSWDAMYLTAEAIKLSGNPDNPEAIRDGYYKIKDFPMVLGRRGARGSFEIGRNHMTRVEDLVYYVVRSGKFVKIEGF